MRTLTCAFTTVFLLEVSPVAFGAATSGQTLADLLAPAFLAQNVATICVARDSSFLSDIGGLPAVNAFVQHISHHVLDGLPLEREAQIRRDAADQARAAALATIRQLQDPSPAIEAQRMNRWCRESGSILVTTALQDHDTNHNAFVDTVSEGRKRP